ncbi:MAG: hypothetical protein ABJP02_04925 [Parasphingorhabdus sp.]|uniref:hypothetical protein n=1 Tax=Parasphingorhabdus sp. TaxID=2709688 RepID=UPI0032987F6E
MTKLVAVKFLMPHTVGSLYNEGETAGFEKGVADDLVKRKIAEPAKTKKAKEDEPPADPVRAELEKLNKDKLFELAKTEEIEVDEGLNKGPLIDAIIAGRAAK